ncbi:unnamed protein product, partial [Lampetra planeri]
KTTSATTTTATTTTTTTVTTDGRASANHAHWRCGERTTNKTTTTSSKTTGDTVSPTATEDDGPTVEMTTNASSCHVISGAAAAHVTAVMLLVVVVAVAAVVVIVLLICHFRQVVKKKEWKQDEQPVCEVRTKRTPTYLRELKTPLKMPACCRPPNHQLDSRLPRATGSELHTAISPNCYMLQPPSSKKSTWRLRAERSGRRRTFPPSGKLNILNFPPRDHVLPSEAEASADVSFLLQMTWE